MILTLDYSVASVNEIIVLGAGPSINDHLNKIQEEYQNAKIIGSNYNFDIPTDFTLFTGPGTFKKSIANIVSPSVIVTSLVLSKRKRNMEAFLDKNFYVMQNHEGPKVYWEENSINVDPYGVFSHSFANCGFTAILSSHFFRPKRVILCGFDGPSERSDGIYHEHFHGVTRKWKDPKHGITEKHFDRRRNFLRLIVDFLQKRNIDIKVFGKFWGINI